MLVTRTTRRKLALGLGVVLAMLLVLAGAGVWGLFSYRSVVRDLDVSINKAPRRSDLEAAVGQLFEPLLPTDRKAPSAAKIQRRQQEFALRLADARRELDVFRNKLGQLPQTDFFDARGPATNSLLVQIDAGLKKLEADQMHLANPDRKVRSLAEHFLLHDVGRLSAAAHAIPDSRDGLAGSLVKARSEYRAHFELLAWSAGIAVTLFLAVGMYGYRSFLKPLCKLHQGAIRVAHGDFDYRLSLAGADEMVELADAFNRMTDRFQEKTEELDEQVHEQARQLVRSERLAGIGFLAAGVAHEINNPLSAISMAAESLAGSITLGGECTADARVTSQYLQMIQRESARCRDITRRLLEFARGQDEARIRVDLKTIVDEVLAMVRAMSKYRDRTIEFSQSRPCYIEANGPEIKQVVLNLVSNALEAMDSGGLLTIHFHDRTDRVQIVFKDNGCGMTEEVRQNLFEPFFTRRRDGKGTGLGMAISQRIIGDHDGTIEAASEGPGRGSTFTVHLPRRCATVQAA